MFPLGLTPIDATTLCPRAIQWPHIAFVVSDRPTYAVYIRSLFPLSFYCFAAVNEISILMPTPHSPSEPSYTTAA